MGYTISCYHRNNVIVTDSVSVGEGTRRGRTLVQVFAIVNNCVLLRGIGLQVQTFRRLLRNIYPRAYTHTHTHTHIHTQQDTNENKACLLRGMPSKFKDVRGRACVHVRVIISLCM